MDVRVRVASLSFSAARIHASASTAVQSGGMPSYIPPSCASKGASVRPTFTLHARFRYARSTFVNLYLNYKSNAQHSERSSEKHAQTCAHLIEARPLRAGVWLSQAPAFRAPRQRRYPPVTERLPCCYPWASRGR